MRLAFAMFLLVGCAVGQGTLAGTLVGPGTGQWSQFKHGTTTTVCIKTHYAEKGLTDAERCFYPTHPGDCYRVKQDGTLEKVDECYSTSELVEWKLTSESVDVPAVKVPIPKEQQSQCGPQSCDWETSTCLAVCTPPETERSGCADPNRILIGPDGRGKYFCHLPKTNN